MPLGNITGPLGKKRAAHLLRRACFGASIEDINLFATLTPQEALERLIIEELPDPPLPIDPLTGTEWITLGTTDANSENFQLTRYLNAWMIGQALANGVEESLKNAYSFRERIVFFLHTLFTTKQSIAGNSRTIYYQQALFRKYAFDQNDRLRPDEDPELPDIPVYVNIKELTKKVSVDNAMLVFLDGRLNVKGSPNENYARELLELYSVGRGLEGLVPEPAFDGDYYFYTEEDVQEGAKVLSGFDVDYTFQNIDPETDLPRGKIKGGITASQHDNGTKQFSERMGNATIVPDPELLLSGNPTEESSLDEISQLIDIIYEQDETPIHICRRLYRFFVYHEVDEDLQNDVIAEMVEILKANDYKIIPVISALFSSEHFYEGAAGFENDNYGSLIKSPFDLVVGFHKNFKISTPDFHTDIAQYYNYFSSLLRQIANQGMDLYEPFEVAGYPAYHQFPIYNRSWINTNYLTNRYNYISGSLSNGNSVDMGQLDVLEFIQNTVPNSVASDPKALIIELVSDFLPVSENLSFDSDLTSELTQERLGYFLYAFLYDPQLDMNPEEDWTIRWNAGSDPEKTANQLVQLLNAILQSPEYQLM